MKKNVSVFLESHPMLPICLLAFCILIIWSFLILSIAGVVSLDITSFAVDSEETLYVGTSCDIRIFANGECTGVIPVLSKRPYAFTVQSDGTILWVGTDSTEVWDRSGNVLSKDAAQSDLLRQLEKEDRIGFHVNGSVYKRSGIIWPKIVKNGSEVVYRLPLLSVIYRVLMPVSGLIFALCIVYLKLYGGIERVIAAVQKFGSGK